MEKKEVYSKIYSSVKARRAMSSIERKELMDAYIQLRLECLTDDGKNGKVLEVDARRMLVPATITLHCQKAGFRDIPMRFNGKMINLECKSGGGCLAEKLYFEDWKNELDLEKVLKFDYILYMLDYSGNQQDILCDAVILSKAAFIQYLETWKKGATGVLTYKTQENRLMIANPRVTNERESFWSEGIMDYAESTEDCYSFAEFAELVGR